ncbi:hypothetical protein [Helicobacter trogontum]|nr:hypothetical protein [Helicobacter trogontum]MDY5185350.1 hypothetical protein [Helicobacter trogontum]
MEKEKNKFFENFLPFKPKQILQRANMQNYNHTILQQKDVLKALE